MLTKATKILLCVLFLFTMSANKVLSQLYLETGKVGIRLSNAGSIRLYSPTTNDLRQLDRVNIIAALSEQAVCDYNEDQDMVIDAYQLTTPTVADIEAIAVYDNRYSDLPPEVKFRVHVYAWNDDPYVIARYTIINEEAEQATYYLGAVALPMLSGNYGGETNVYNAEHGTAYCYREGEFAYAGYRLLSKEPYSYHALDWSEYSPDDPNSDAATDSTRYHMTADPGFDSTMTAGGDGSLCSLNAGAYTIASGDSVILTYAIVYADIEADLFTASDAAQNRYDNVLVSVDDFADSKIPTSFSLAQNYPNPFNPTTGIRFDLDKNSDIQLAVYNLQGQLVNTIASGAYPAGSHLATWNGKDSSGKDVGSGVYIYRLTTDKMTLTKKMLLVR